MNIAIAAARPGRVRDRPDRLAIVSIGWPSVPRICSTTRKLPSVIAT